MILRVKKTRALKTIATFAAFLAVSAVLVSAQAATKKDAAAAATNQSSSASEVAADSAAATQPAANGSKKKTTDVSFEDVLVQGKYHFSDEAVTTVEQDKVLDALLGVRTDFKDRLKKSAARH